jgi:hypothetical protein
MVKTGTEKPGFRISAFSFQLSAFSFQLRIFASSIIRPTPTCFLSYEISHSAAWISLVGLLSDLDVDGDRVGSR